MNSEIKGLQKAMQETKPIINMTKEEFEYAQKPIGNAIYQHNLETKIGRPRKENKAKPSDRIKCKICSKEYTRSCATSHKKTQYHKLHESLNIKLIEFIVKK